jgi:hypothetical protein
VVGSGTIPLGTQQVTVSFTIPEASYGNNFVQFIRSYRPENPYGFSFTVEPDLTVTSPTCTPHATVTIKGTGFPAKDDNIKVSFDGTDTGMSILTNDVGSFTGQFTLPETMAGNHQFKATDSNMAFGDITANLQVGPTISLQPEHPDIGTQVTMTGCGFAARSTVSIKYDDQVVSNSPTTSDTGSFTDAFNVPASSQANHVITATDGAGNVATFGMPLSTTPPPAPNTISPVDERFGWFGSQPVVFTWSDVSDPSGVTYTLEVDKTLRFFPLDPGMRKTGLTQPTAVMTLDPGTYYWRVKAIDGAGNESPWSLSS